MSCKLHISYATKNKDKRQNQDNCMVDKFLACVSRLSEVNGEMVIDTCEKRLFLVSDGAGGTSEGEKASEITVKTIFDCLDNIKSKDDEGDIKTAIDTANLNVIKYFDTTGFVGAATLSGVLFSGFDAFVFNVGDSPVFLLNNGVLSRVHKEHTVAAEKYGVTGCRKDGEDANTITRYMGRRDVSGSEQTYFSRIDIDKNMVFLIASDGVEKGLSDRAIKRILSKKRGNTANKLVRRAYKGKAGDDITAIVIRVK